MTQSAITTSGNVSGQIGINTAITASAGGVLDLHFDPSTSTAHRVDNNLVFELDTGGVVTITDFFAVGDQSLPALRLPDGTIVASADFFAGSDLDMSTAAGPAAGTPMGGGTNYVDDAGNLLGGLDRLGALVTDYWTRATETPEDVFGLNSTGAAVAGLSASELPEGPAGVPADELEIVLNSSVTDAPGFTVYEKYLNKADGALYNGSVANSMAVWSDLQAFTFDVDGGFGSITIGDAIIGWSDLDDNGTLTTIIQGKYGLLEVTLALAADGKSGEVAYQYLLTSPADHVDGNGTNTDIKGGNDEVFAVIVMDSIGNEAKTGIQVAIVDDVPVVNVTDGIFHNTDGIEIHGTLAAMGADGEGARIEFALDSLAMGTDSVWSHGGLPVTVQYGLTDDGQEDRSVLVGTVGGQVVFTLTGHSDGTYTYHQYGTLDILQKENIKITAKAMSDGGNERYYSVMPNGSLVTGTAPQSGYAILILAKNSSGANVTVNGNNNALGVAGGGKIGVGNQLILSLATETHADRMTLTLTASNGNLGGMAEIVAYCYALDGSSTVLVEVRATGFTADGQVVLNAPEGYYIDHVVVTGQDKDTGIVSFNTSILKEVTGLPLEAMSVDFLAIDGDGDAVGGTLTLQAQHQNDGGLSAPDDGRDYILMAGGDEGYTLVGGSGNDTIYGSVGDDIIYGGSGDDILFGFGGSDIFAWKSEHLDGGTDTIMDFRLGEDSLRFDDLFDDTDLGDLDTLEAMLRDTVFSIEVIDNDVLLFTLRYTDGQGNELRQNVQMYVAENSTGLELHEDALRDIAIQAQLLQQILTNFD